MSFCESPQKTETVTHNGTKYAYIELPKPGEKVLVEEPEGKFLEVIVDFCSAGIMSEEITWGLDKVLRRVEPQAKDEGQLDEHSNELVDFKMSDRVTIKILKGSEKTAEVFKELFKDIFSSQSQQREPKPAETKYRRDPNKPQLDFKKHSHNLKVGDMVFDWVRGPASSGGMYDIGLVVVDITKDKIITRDERGRIDKWHRVNGCHEDPKSAYFLAFFQESTNP